MELSSVESEVCPRQRLTITGHLEEKPGRWGDIRKVVNQGKKCFRQVGASQMGGSTGRPDRLDCSLTVRQDYISVTYNEWYISSFTLCEQYGDGQAGKLPWFQAHSLRETIQKSLLSLHPIEGKRTQRLIQGYKWSAHNYMEVTVMGARASWSCYSHSQEAKRNKDTHAA